VQWLGSTVLRTCVRVMKPAGKLVLTTNLVGQMQEFYEVYWAVLHELGLVDRLTALDAHVHHRATIASVRCRKRNKKVAIKPRRRRHTGAHLDLAGVVRFVPQPHLVAEGEKTDERMNIPRYANAHARPRPSMSHLSLPAPRDGSVWPTVPLLLFLRLYS
jgi:hypothetical protein